MTGTKPSSKALLWREALNAARNLGDDHWKQHYQYEVPDFDRLLEAAWVHGYIASRSASSAELERKYGALCTENANHKVRAEAAEARLAEAERERDEWKAAALMAGEYCGETIGPTGYYGFSVAEFKQWFATTVAYKRTADSADDVRCVECGEPRVRHNAFIHAFREPI